MAMTDSAKAKSRASQGLIAKSANTVMPRTGIPRTGLEEARDTSTILAMMEARMMLGSGVTRITKPTRAIIPEPILIHTPPRKRATSATTIATTIAQLAPETATRWLREVMRIASINPRSTAEVSPMARPGNRRPPSPGRSSDADTKPWRRSSIPDKKAPGGVTFVAGPRAIRIQPELSLGSACWRYPASSAPAPYATRFVKGKPITLALTPPPASSTPLRLRMRT